MDGKPDTCWMVSLMTNSLVYFNRDNGTPSRSICVPPVICVFAGFVSVPFDGYVGAEMYVSANAAAISNVHST